MKKYLLVLFTIFITASYAENYLGERIDDSQRVVYSYYDNSDWTIGLEDGSSWRIHILKDKREKTWYEWWNEITPKEWDLEESFFFDPSDWSENNELSISRTTGNLYDDCAYILENHSTNQKAFAKFIPYNFIPKMRFIEPFLEEPELNQAKISCTFQDCSSVLNNTLILEDDSCWVIFPFKENASSWSQWWKGEEVDQPDPEFVFESSNWCFNDSLKLYFHEGDLDLIDKYQPNHSKFNRLGVYLIRNLSRSQVAYANKVPLSKLVKNFQTEKKREYQKGYNNGYDNGRLAENQLEYDRGYTAGEKAGKRLISIVRPEGALESSYEKGFSEGYKTGYDFGYEEGYAVEIYVE